MKFSICIPNYNYGKFIGRTIQSVLDQDFDDFEIVISDNASTDNSWDVITSFRDPCVKPFRNRCNVGFAGNLDRAACRATGDFMIMLSSDDLMRPKALNAYDEILSNLADAANRTLITSTCEIIDQGDAITGKLGPDPELWPSSGQLNTNASSRDGNLLREDASQLLRRCLLTMKNPFNFAATCYPRELYLALEGYGGGRLINPDKWFHWKLLSVAHGAYFIDQPLFAYRWHANNQVAQQASISALKFQVDEYLSTLELDEKVLSEIGLTREQVESAFVEYDIARHGLATLGRGDRSRARRILDFGTSAYPRVVQSNRKAWALRALLVLGPMGSVIAAWAYQRRLAYADEKLFKC